MQASCHLKEVVVTKMEPRQNVFGIHKIRIASRSNGFQETEYYKEKKAKTSIQDRSTEQKMHNG
jgi:hypothetical protein